MPGAVRVVFTKAVSMYFATRDSIDSQSRIETNVYDLRWCHHDSKPKSQRFLRGVRNRLSQLAMDGQLGLIVEAR